MAVAIPTSVALADQFNNITIVGAQNQTPSLAVQAYGPGASDAAVTVQNDSATQSPVGKGIRISSGSDGIDISVS